MMHNPPHPGEVIRELCLDPLGISLSDAAKAIGVCRKTLSELVNGHAGVSPRMALRLSMAFGPSAESWLAMQMNHDLWRARRSAGKMKVKRLAAV
jgi:addiction module HigA family antidote